MSKYKILSISTENPKGGWNTIDLDVEDDKLANEIYNNNTTAIVAYCEKELGKRCRIYSKKYRSNREYYDSY